MAEIKLNVQSSDKIKALIGDLGIECEIPVSALLSYTKGQVSLDDVCEVNATTDKDLQVRSLSATDGIVFTNSTLNDIEATAGSSIVADTLLILTMGDSQYRILGQLVV